MAAAEHSKSPKKSRENAPDVARGLAVLSMLLWHAADGWLATGLRDTRLFAFINFIGQLALPLFLFLAGYVLELALQRGKSIWTHGVRILVGGYALNAALALIDGGMSIARLFRVDILHCIGLSILCFFGITRLSKRYLPLVMLASAVTLAIFPLHSISNQVDGSIAGYLLGLFVDVPNISVFPLIPLVVIFFLGVIAARVRNRTLWVGLPIAIVSHWAFWQCANVFPGPISRAHPAIIFNIFDLAGRAAFILWLSTFCAKNVLSAWVRLLGRRSLLIYALHLSIAFGALSPFRSNASWREYTLGVGLLILLMSGLAYLRENGPKLVLKS